MSQEIALAPGASFEKYVMVRLVGEGGMGSVYEAQHAQLRRRVAIKVLHPRFVRNHEALARFVREGEAAARLQHPNVVSISDIGVFDGVPFMVMDFLEGEDLSTLLDREQSLSPTAAADLMVPVCSAVALAHDAGIVHRDLKPANIFLAQTVHGLQPKLLDFGISKLDGPGAGLALTGTSAMLGTPYYMSPEQVRQSRSVDARADQYALGVILYECVAGRRPFEADVLLYLMQAIEQGRFDPPSQHQPALPEGFDALIRRAMAREPSERFNTVLDLGASLLPFASASVQALWAGKFAPGATDSRPSRPATPVPVTPAPLNPAPEATASSIKPVAGPAATRLGIAPAELHPTTSHDLARDASAGPAGLLSVSAPPPPAPPVPPWIPSGSPQVSIGPQILPTSETALSPPRRWPWLVGAGAAAVMVGGAALFMVFNTRAPTGSTRPPPPVAVAAPLTPTERTFHVGLTVTPAEASIELDGHPVGSGSLERDLPRDGTEHLLRVSAAGCVPETLAFRDVPPPPGIHLAPLPTTVPSPNVPGPVALGHPASATSHPAAPNRPPGPHRVEPPSAVAPPEVHPIVAAPPPTSVDPGAAPIIQ